MTQQEPLKIEGFPLGVALTGDALTLFHLDQDNNFWFPIVDIPVANLPQYPKRERQYPANSPLPVTGRVPVVD